VSGSRNESGTTNQRGELATSVDLVLAIKKLPESDQIVGATSSGLRIPSVRLKRSLLRFALVLTDPDSNRSYLSGRLKAR